jgi:hypothetical protein
MCLERARLWASQERMRLVLLRQMGPLTIVAYARIAGAIVSERLWDVPFRLRRPRVSGQSAGAHTTR